MAQYSINQAKTHLTKLIAAALDGSDIVIARGKVPAVRLVPIAPRGQRRFGALKGKIAINARIDEPLPENELHGWTR